MKTGTGNIILNLTGAQMNEALSEYLAAHFGELMEGRLVEQVRQEQNAGGISFVIMVADNKTPHPASQARAA